MKARGIVRNSLDSVLTSPYLDICAMRVVIPAPIEVPVLLLIQPNNCLTKAPIHTQTLREAKCESTVSFNRFMTSSEGLFFFLHNTELRYDSS